MSQHLSPVVPPDLPPMPVPQKMLKMEEAGQGVTRYKDRAGTLLTEYYAFGLQRSIRSFDVSHNITYAIETGHLADGLKQGQWQVRYHEKEEGLDYDLTYEKGFLNGPLTVYNSDRQVRYKTNFTRGNGLWKIFFGNAKPKIEGELKDGQPDGIWQQYSHDGLLEERRVYQLGTLLSTFPTPR